MKRTSPWQRFIRATLTATLVVSAGAAAAAATELDQRIDQNQEQGQGQVVLDHGHVDFGASLTDDGWVLQVHDDTATPAVWRNTEDTVFHVLDEAQLTVPESEEFAFLNVEPGQEVHVVPQTEQPGIIWVGWNTQHPQLLESIDRGLTLRLHGVEGPGEMVAYLQAGNFGEPTQLFATHNEFPQDAWIEMNTHTHANWVFTEPGTYLVDAEFTGEFIDGEELSARGTLRFAVGTGTDPSEGLAAPALNIDSENSADSDETAEQNDAAEQGTADVADNVWILVGLGALVLILVIILVVSFSARARRKAKAEAAAEKENAV